MAETVAPFGRISVFSKMSLLVLIAAVCLFILLLTTLTLGRGGLCDDMEDCDAFKPVCATYKSEHQFFYSQCDLIRENCLTGANWKLDHFNHCNVAI